MTERSGNGMALYLCEDDGRLYEIAGVGRMEDEQGVIRLLTTDGPLVLTRAEIRGQR
jgi:hypothetical protein